MNDFLSNNLNHVVKGDCLELFKKLENNSIDVVFTSPPISVQEEETTKNI